MCYAVSTTSDPMGEYYRYEFQRPLFPDYPRPAIWSDENGQPHVTTYRELRERVNRTAHVLVNVMGLVPGNRILLRGQRLSALQVRHLRLRKRTPQETPLDTNNG